MTDVPEVAGLNPRFAMDLMFTNVLLLCAYLFGPTHYLSFKIVIPLAMLYY